jgi:hypothetical protein
VFERAAPIAGFLKMVRQELRVTFDRIGTKLDQGNGDLAVQLGPWLRRRVPMAASWIRACLN